MIQKFQTVKQKKILVGIVDNHHLCQSGWSHEVSKNLSDFLLHRFVAKDFDVWICTDEDQLLNEAASENYTHAVIVASGTSTKLSDRLFSAIDKLCQQDFCIAGHLIDRVDGYYEIHHQFYVVNLSEYKDLGSPFVGQAEEVSHSEIKPIRSSEVINNNPELPVTISQGTDLTTYSSRWHGWNIFSKALNSGKRLVDLGPEIRNNKFYLYYEYDHVFLRQLRELTYNEFFVTNFFAGWNSDAIKNSINFQGPVEQYITVGIGFNWVYNLKLLGITESTKVIFTDINHQCLDFMRKLATEWDGKDYHEFYKNNFPEVPVGSQDPTSYFLAVENEWKSFRDSFDDWDQFWLQVKQLKFDFVLIDYMANYNLEWITPGLKTLINLSDVFTHVPYVATQSLKYRVSCENYLINQLRSKDPEIFLLMTSRATDGFHPETSRIKQDVVKNFDLTDINVIKKPSWHNTDWVSPRMLG
jgi:hypothetical protein